MHWSARAVVALFAVSCAGEDPPTAAPRPSGTKGATRCDLTKPFSQSVAVAFDAASMYCRIGSLSQDELRMDLVCLPLDLHAPLPIEGPVYVSRRGGVTEPWGPLVHVVGPFPERIDVARVADDGLTILYGEVTEQPVPGSSNGGTHYVSTLYSATRADSSAPFGPARHLDEVSPRGSTASFDVVAASSDLSVFYFSQSPDISPTEAVVRAERSPDGGWHTGDAPFGLRRTGFGLGAMTSDELHAFWFAPPQPPEQQFDIWFAARASRDDGFPEPSRAVVENVSTPEWDWPAWVSDDGCVVYTRARDIPNPVPGRIPATHYRAERPAK